MKRIFKKNKIEIKLLQCLIITVAVIFIALVVYPLIPIYFFPDNQNMHMSAFDVMAARGQFGDQFGALTCLFTGLAFALLVYTAQLQRIDLRIQSRELADTRKVIELQRQEMAEQNKTMAQQRFENTFFQMLLLYTEIREGQILKKTKTTVNAPEEVTLLKGEFCFNALVNIFNERLNKFFSSNRDNHLFKTANDIFNDFYDRHAHFLYNYYSFLVSFLKFIDASSLDNRGFYINLLRAHMSVSEIEMLLFRVLFNHDPELVDILSKYEFFFKGMELLEYDSYKQIFKEYNGRVNL